MSHCVDIIFGLSVLQIAYNMYAAFNNLNLLLNVGVNGVVFYGHLWQGPTVITGSTILYNFLWNLLCIFIGLVTIVGTILDPLVLLRYVVQVIEHLTTWYGNITCFLSRMRLTLRRLIIQQQDGRCLQCGIFHHINSPCFGLQDRPTDPDSVAIEIYNENPASEHQSSNTSAKISTLSFDTTFTDIGSSSAHHGEENYPHSASSAPRSARLVIHTSIELRRNSDSPSVNNV